MKKKKNQNITGKGLIKIQSKLFPKEKIKIGKSIIKLKLTKVLIITTLN